MMSLVTTNANMFGPDGIYANSESKTLEAPGSFEYFNPLSGTTDFGSEAGICMYGGVGRDTQYLKHGMEVPFESAEGKTYLDENIFGDGYLPDGLVLRQAFNDGWSWGGASTAFIHDSWVRDALTALGTQNTPGIWVQLFVNGLYWGVYNAVADIDADYSAYFFGGQPSDYDVYHYSSTGFEVKSGTIAALGRPVQRGDIRKHQRHGHGQPDRAGQSDGLRPYGAIPQPAVVVRLHHRQLLCRQLGLGQSQLLRPLQPEPGLRLPGLGRRNDALQRLEQRPQRQPYRLDTTGGPTQLFVQLLANPDFRQMFADHVYKDLSTALSPTNAAAMYSKEANTISTAVLDESARWGNLGELDGTWGELGTPATWSAHINTELELVVPHADGRDVHPIRNGRDVYSRRRREHDGVHLHDVSEHRPAHAVRQWNGGERGAFTPTAALTMTATTGTIYYTTDGSDPRTSTSGFTVSTLTLSGTTATATIDGDTDTGLSNGETIYISGASPTAYDGTFSIAAVTVNSAAGTTTFTYTVSGSPASPATPLISGQPIIAATSLGGAVGATAQVYSGAITLTQDEQINARVLSGSTWSALNSSAFYVNLAPDMRITELMYDPLPATAAEIAKGYVVSDTTDPNKDFEFVELQNIGSTTVPLQGLTFSNGVTFTFPDVTLAAGAYIVACSDPAAFAIRYGESILETEYGSTNWTTVATECAFSGHFAMGGEEVTLTAPNGGVIQDFTYSNSWYPQTGGGGFSLVARSATQALSLWNSSLGWEPSGTPNGTPGGPETVVIPLPGSIVVNEALSNPTGVPDDMIEFYNTTSQPINIGGWFVSDSSTNLMKYEIAAGTVIAANGYYVLTADNNFGALAGDPGCLVPFGLNANGDDVYLCNNYGGQPGGYYEHQTIPAMPPGAAYGLYTKSDGATNFTLLQTPGFGTLSGTTYSGAAPGIPYVSPLVTDEIMYNPSQPTAAEAAAGYVDSDFEYAEVYNRSSSPVVLDGYYVGNGIGYTPGWLADGSLANDFTVSSITGYPLAGGGTTATVTLATTSTGFQNGDEIHIDGAAQRLRRRFHHRQRDGEFRGRDDYLYLHGEWLARFARHAGHGAVAHGRQGQRVRGAGIGGHGHLDGLRPGREHLHRLRPSESLRRREQPAHRPRFAGPVHGDLRRCADDGDDRPEPGARHAQRDRPDVQQHVGAGDGDRQQRGRR